MKIFLKVFYLMATISPITSTFVESKNPKIVVVGAGLAGLTTAYRLHQKGVDVDVYEARSRVGGRVLTVKIDNTIAELGGQNITDGGEAKNMLRLVEEFGLELTGNKISFNQSYFDGEKLLPVQQLLENKKFEPEKLRAQLNTLAQKSKNMREVLNGILEEQDPLYKVLAVRLAGYEGASIDKLSPLYIETLYHMLLGGVAAAHHFDSEDERYVDFLTIKKGNALLAEKIAETLGDKLHLNKPLVKVAKTVSGSFVLTFHGGEEINADRLVLAIPCSVYEDICFDENALPLDRLEDIKNVKYGTNAKIIIPFSKSPSKRIGFINDRVGSFFDVNCHLLTMYYTGNASYFTPETIFRTYEEDRPMIEKGFGEECPLLSAPIFAKDQAFCAYEGPVGYSWPNDPYAKGTYSYIAAGQEDMLTELNVEHGEMVKTLFAPIDQKLYFVGEHASVLMETPGTMEAACESGERIARMILSRSAL